MNGSTLADETKCQYCGNNHSGVCPMIKKIDYHQNGTIKSVELRGDQTPVSKAVNIPEGGSPLLK